MRFRVCAAGSLVVLFSGVGSAVAAVEPSQSLIASAVRAQGSFHYVSTWHRNGVTVHVVGDAATDQGIQRVTYSKGGHTGHATVLVIADTAYVRSDAFTLIDYIGAPAAVAAKDAGKWLKIDHSNRGFATVASQVRLDSSWLRGIHMPSSAHNAGTTTMDGQLVRRLQATLTHGTETATQTRYVRASGTPLPMAQTIVSKGKLVYAVHFSRWGESLHITVTPKAVALVG